MIPNINLLPQDQYQPKRKNSLMKLIIIVLLLIVIIFYGINYYLLSNDIAKMEKKTDQLATQIQTEEKTLTQVQSNPSYAIATSVQFAEKYQTPISNIIEVANKYMTGSGELAGLDYKDGQVEFIVYFDNLNEASTFVRNLDNEAIFKTVKLDSASTFTKVDVDNVGEEQTLNENAQYKAIILTTLNPSATIKTGGAK